MKYLEGDSVASLWHGSAGYEIRTANYHQPIGHVDLSEAISLLHTTWNRINSTREVLVA